MPHSHSNGQSVVVVADQAGLTIIPSPSPLTSLNYFDGKFLRAADLDTEKRYVRKLVELSNQGLGAGVVHGLDTTLATGDAIRVGPGMAIDPMGRILLLPTEAQVRIDELIEGSRRLSSRPAAGERPKAALAAIGMAPSGKAFPASFDDCEDLVETPPSGIAHADDLWLVSIGHAEALCGHEDVFGRLCDEGCVTRADRPFRVEGVVIRATPLVLATRLVDSGVIAIDRRHLRSRIASAYFADDAVRVGSLISRAGLAADTWCLGARLDGGSDVPIAVLARSGATTLFLDAWTARRERTEAPAKRYWARRMAMRPWDAYLAQILQFQCQLHDLLGGVDEPGRDDDPCRPQQTVLSEAAKVLEDVESHYTNLIGTALAAMTPATDASGQPIEFASLPGGLARIALLRNRIRTALDGAFTGPSRRVLIDGGIVETPSAAYLPVVPGSGITVNEQVRRLLGDGVDLRFCVVRADFVPHALEEAQHMERISLIAGLDHPEAKPRVDVLVPDGEIQKVDVTPTGMGFATTVRLHLGPANPGIVEDSDDARLMMRSRLTPVPSSALEIRGAGRGELMPSGRMAFHMAGAAEAKRSVRAADFIHAIVGRPVENRTAAEFLAEIPTTPEAEHAADEARPMLASRLRTLAGSAADHLRSVRIADASLAPEPAAPAEAFSVALAPGERRVVALWTSMTIDADLRSISPGGTADLRGDFALVAPSRLGSTERLTIRGELRVDQATDTPTGRRIVGLASLSSTHREIREGVPQAIQTQTDELRVVIDLDLRAGVLQSLKLRLQSDDRAVLAVAATWTFGPLSVNVRLSSGRDLEQDLADVDALESATALLPGSEPHTLAMSAIEIIGAALQDPGFRDAAQRALFATVEASQSDLIVRATRDWVLFHRRRDITCDVAAEAPVVAPPRRYALFQRSVKDLREAETIRRALLSQDSDTIARVGLRQVDVVDFGGGVAALATPADSVRQDWVASQPGDRIIYSFIASAAPGDGDLLARGRLGRLLDTLATVTPLDAAAATDAVSGVPASLAISGLDGAIVELTIAVATTCVRVVRVDYEGEGGEEPKVTVANGAAVLKIGHGSRMLDLGQVTFAQDQSDVASGAGAVKDAWTNLGAGPSDLIVVVSGKGDDAAGAPSLRKDRGAAVAEFLPVVPREIRLTEVEEPLKDCPTTVVVIARPPAVAVDCMAVHVVDEKTFKRISGATANAEVQQILAAAGRHLGDAQFETSLTRFETSPSDIADAWKATGLTADEITFVFSQRDDPRAGSQALRTGRVKSIFQATGIPSAGINDTQFDDPVSGPCAAIMVVFAPVTIATDCHDVWLVRNPDVFKKVLDQSTMKNVEAILLQVPVDAAIFLGEATFLAGTADLAADLDSIRKGFEDGNGGEPTTAGVSALSKNAGGDPALQEQRAVVILEKLGVADHHEVRVYDDPVSDGCQAVTVLFHQP